MSHPSDNSDFFSPFVLALSMLQQMYGKEWRARERSVNKGYLKKVEVFIELQKKKYSPQKKLVGS